MLSFWSVVFMTGRTGQSPRAGSLPISTRPPAPGAQGQAPQPTLCPQHTGTQLHTNISTLSLISGPPDGPRLRSHIADVSLVT